MKFSLGSANKAKVAIANRMARAIFKVLGGECYKDIGYARGDPREKQIDKLVRQLRALGVEIAHQDHELIYSVKKISVEASGIVLS